MTTTMNKLGGTCLVTMLLLIGPAEMWAQRHVLMLRTEEELPGRIARTQLLRNAQEADVRARDLLAKLHSKGYLAASFEDTESGKDTTTMTLHLGEVYQWASLSTAGVHSEYLSRVGFRDKLFRGQPLSPVQVVRLMETLLRHAEENGHPFATIGLEGIERDQEGMRAELRMETGRLVTIDSVIVRGSARLAPRYLHRHIGIRPGDPYDESLIVALEQRMRELTFVTQRQKPYVLFTPEWTKLYLFLDRRKASSINGILGVLPDAATGRVAITGDIDLRLRNVLDRGESIDLNWRSLKDRTQDLKVRTQLPYLFNTPFGAELGLKLFRRDTSFMDVNGRAAVQYLMRQGEVLSVFVNSRSSRTLGRSRQFQPGLANLRMLSYGLGLERWRLDYRPNPRRGHALLLEGSAGVKESSIPDPDDPLVTTTTKTPQYEVNATLLGHVPTGRRGTIRLALQSGTMIADRIFVNELHRLGGIKSLRGFDEASIYASSYAIGTAEFRVLLEENSNVFLFVDQAWWEDRSRPDALNDTPTGFGAGINFETKAGIFGLTYALGRSFSLPVELRSGKIHFGFTSLF